MTIQIVLLDIRGYIIDYRDFRAADQTDIARFITEALVIPDVVKVEVKKWKV